MCVIKLCEEYRGPRRISGLRYEHWSLVSKVYLHIRQIIKQSVQWKRLQSSYL